MSVVHCWRPLMYKFVFDKVSWTCGVPFGPIVVFVFVLLRLVLIVPLWEPVFDELLEFVLLGDAAVGTRGPYYNCRVESWMKWKENLVLLKWKIGTYFTENFNWFHLLQFAGTEQKSGEFSCECTRNRLIFAIRCNGAYIFGSQPQ